jgi:formylglycine-generating enzyme required for sulfatase activity
VWEQLLAADPSARYPSVAAVADALAPFAAEVGRGRRDRRTWLALAVAVIAVGVAVLGVLRPWRDRGAGSTHTVDSSDRTVEANPPDTPVGQLPMTPEEATALQAAWAKQIGRPTELTDPSGMKVVLVPPGEFTLSGECRVRISKPYYVGATEVTVGQFRAFATAEKYQTDVESAGGYYFGVKSTGHAGELDPRLNWRTPGHETVTDDHPVTQVSWRDAVRFCEWKTRQEGVTYRLPTEAEWLWAARAGDPVTGMPSETRNWNEVAWCRMNATQPQPVGRLQANPWGLHDVLGNVSEWCQDWYAKYPSKKQTLTDWAGPKSGEAGRRVFLGTPHLSPIPLRFDFRDSIMEWSGTSYLGFRVVREVGSKPTAPQ